MPSTPPARRAILALLALFVTVIALVSPPPAHAEEGAVDWRAALACPAEHQVQDGALYCTTKYLDQTVDVLVADLAAPAIRFEYLSPQDYSRGTLRECRDPNRPEYAGEQEGGCLAQDGIHHPTMTLQQAIALDKTYQEANAAVIPHDIPLAAVINADYGAPASSQDHGAEGLMVIRGTRLDGVEHCDDDYGAALRPWLALGETVDKATGLIPSAIDRLPRDTAAPPEWTYTAFGGGPVLLHEGQINGAADACASDPPYQLKVVDPVTNCAGKQKVTKAAPLTEGYGGSCYPTAHTAAGLSGDRRWLFLVINEGQMVPEQLAKFMRDVLGVTEALKLDGGGSSSLWFKGQFNITVNPVVGNRPLSNWLAIHTNTGTGIDLPLDASPPEPVMSRVRTDDEEAKFTLAFKNDGPFTWMPDDTIGIAEAGLNLAGAESPLLYRVEQPVGPGDAIKIEWQETAKGLSIRRFQMSQHGRTFGEPVQVIVATVPPTLAARKDELQAELDRIVAEAKAKGEEGLRNLVAQVQQWFVEQSKNLLQRLIDSIVQELEKALQQVCGSAGTGLAPAVVALVLAGRRCARRRGGNE